MSLSSAPTHNCTVNEVNNLQQVIPSNYNIYEYIDTVVD